MVSRRGFLASLGVASLGALGLFKAVDASRQLPPDEQPGSVFLQNNDAIEHSLTVSLMEPAPYAESCYEPTKERTGDCYRVVFQQSHSLPPDEQHVVDDAITMTGQYRAVVTTGEGEVAENGRIQLREDGTGLTGMVTIAQVVEGGDVIVNGYTGPGVGNPPKPKTYPWTN